MKKIEDMIKELSPDLQQEVEDFIQFLVEKRARKPAGQLKLHWRGAMRDMRDQHSSVDLQHTLLDLWGH